MKKRKFRKNIKETTLTYLVAAFGLVAGLAWNDAIETLIEAVFNLDRSTIIAKFIYAGIITLFVILFTSYLKRVLFKNAKK